MHSKTKIISTLSISTMLLLFSGCVPQELNTPEPVENTSVKRSQELVIKTDIKTTEVKKKSSYHYQVALDNITKTKVDLILQNKGEKPLNIKDIKLEDNSGYFKMSSTCKDVIEGRKKCTLSLAFTGKKQGRFSAIVRIQSDDRRRKTTNILVLAKSKNKYHGAIEEIESTVEKSQKTVELKFNAINTTQYVQIANDGLGKLALKAPKISGQDRGSFSYKWNCPSSLEIGQKCEMTVNYTANKKDGISDAMISIPSNGDISPSKYIRLEGYSKPFSVSLNNFVVSKNIHHFMDDHFSANKSYYFRTIYQRKTDRFFEQGVDSAISKYFEESGFKQASSANRADNKVTIYPSITIVKDEVTNDMSYNIVINGYLTTKSKTSNIKILNDGKEMDNMIHEHNTTDMQFSSITKNDTLFNKEDFEYGMDLQVDNAPDEKEVALTIADMVVSKLFNVLGIDEAKGNR